MDRMSSTATLVLALLFPAAARGALVTQIVPVQAREFRAPGAFPENTGDRLESDPCGIADKTVYALENSIVETQARMWAYLMRQPNFSVRRLAHRPGEEITHPEIRRLFYQRLAFWDSVEFISMPSPEALRRVNNVSTTLRLVEKMRGRGGLLSCSRKERPFDVVLE